MRHLLRSAFNFAAVISALLFAATFVLWMTSRQAPVTLTRSALRQPTSHVTFTIACSGGAIVVERVESMPLVPADAPRTPAPAVEPRWWRKMSGAGLSCRGRRLDIQIEDFTGPGAAVLVSVQVSDDGAVWLPFLRNPIIAPGRTLGELAEAVRDALHVTDLGCDTEVVLGSRWPLLGVESRLSGSASRTGRTETSRRIVPFWLILLAAAALPSHVTFRLMRRASFRRRAAAGLCTACGYNLRATPQRCPECGGVPKRV